MLYTLNLYSDGHQLFLNKTWEKESKTKMYKGKIFEFLGQFMWTFLILYHIHILKNWKYLHHNICTLENGKCLYYNVKWEKKECTPNVS